MAEEATGCLSIATAPFRKTGTQVPEDRNGLQSTYPAEKKKAGRSPLFHAPGRGRRYSTVPLSGTSMRGVFALSVWMISLVAKFRTLRTVFVGALISKLPKSATGGVTAITGRTKPLTGICTTFCF